LANRRALRVHVAAAIVVPGCLALTWWQATRAAGGNTLSWAYTFEWPLFAGYAVYMWWKLVDDPVPGDATTPAAGRPAASGDGDERAEDDRAEDDRAEDDRAEDDRAEDDELAAYNRYLAELNASGRQKHW
jgi:hypothetical protein